jgi:hypothetical protein
MAPTEFHRYTDTRGDTIIYKFDPEIARNPDPAWPNDSAVNVCHHYVLKKSCTINHHSDLLPLDIAMERWRKDKQSSQPIIGMVMYKEDNANENGFGVSLMTQYIWKGWNHGEGYRRGWAKLCVQGSVNEFRTRLPLMWSYRQICGLDRSERVTVAAKIEEKEQTDLDRYSRMDAKAPIEVKERKNSKNPQDSENLQVAEYSQETRSVYSQEKSQQSPVMSVDKRKADLKGVEDEEQIYRIPVINPDKREQGVAASLHKHRNRGKRGKKLVIDYRLGLEEWPGLL